MGEPRDEIIEVLLNYATGIDEKNWDLFRTVFTSDVRADYADFGTWNSADEITAWMEQAHEDTPRTTHQLTNFVIEVEGERAKAKSYVHAVLASADPGRWVDAVGSYEDQLVRREGKWQISERRWVATRILTQGEESPH